MVQQTAFTGTISGLIWDTVVSHDDSVILVAFEFTLGTRGAEYKAMTAVEG